MSEPYKKVGRGGAGNFYSKKVVQERSKATISADPDAPPVIPAPETTTSVPHPPAPAPEYLHTGRGGAGNWLRPSELGVKGFVQQQQDTQDTTALKISDPSSSSSSSSSSSLPAPRKAPPLAQTKPTYRGGRGGAGNYTDYAEEERLRKEEEETARRLNEERIERDVEAGLSRPERAYGGVGGAWEMEPMS